MDQQSNGSDVNINEIIYRVWRTVKKARWLMAVTGIVTVVAANYALRHFVANKYVSEATVLVVDPQLSPNIVSPLSTATMSDRVQVAVGEALAQPRLLTIVNELGLATPEIPPDAAVEALRKNVEIDSYPPSFRISVTAKTPQLAHDIAQKLIDMFMQGHTELQSSEVKTAQNLLDGQLAERRQRLSQLEDSIATYSGEHPDELADERAINLQQLRDAKSRLDSVVASEDSAKRQRTTLEGALSAKLNARVEVLEEERAELLKNFTPKYPDVISKDREIAKAKSEMEEIQQSGASLLGRAGPSSTDPAIVQLESQLDNNAAEIDSLGREKDRQSALIADYQRRLSASPTHEQQLSEMSRQVQELKDDISELTRKRETSEISASMAKLEEGQVFRLIDPPTMPTRPSSKKKKNASLGAALVGPLIGLGLVLLMDLRTPKFFTENQLRKAFVPPLVLSIPVVRTNKERRMRALRVAFEVMAGFIVVVVFAGAEYYGFMLLSQV